jgi:RND family efflux transporter MFP subunit
MTRPAELPPDDLGFELPRPAKLSRVTVAVVVVIAVGAAFVLGYLPHRNAQAKLDSGEVGSAAGAGGPTRVEVVTATEAKSDHAFALPGTVTPLEQTTIYPRVSGYVREWKVDMGENVTQGQLLAEIDTPETDADLAQAKAQLAQAEAALAQAKAHVEFSKVNAARYAQLGDQNLVSKQDVESNQTQADVDRANAAAAEAAIGAAQAAIRKLTDEKAWAHVTAPYAGVITSRTIDRGALVSAGNTTPLYTIAATDPARIFVDVPQTIAPIVKRDVKVKVTAREYPGVSFDGLVAHAAGALDPSLRTMTTEVRVPNPEGKLLPGMYVQAELALPVAHHVLEVPSTSLYSDAQGVRVAVVVDGKIHFAKIGIERDTGATIQVATGLTGSEKIVKVAVPSLTEGEPVEVVAPPPAPAAPAPAAAH